MPRQLWIPATAIAALAFIRWGLPGATYEAGPDDAFITYRYAWNIAHDHGFVFNPGDPPVQGTSTPAYTLLLTVGTFITGADIPSLSVLIGGLASAGCAALLVLLGSQLGYKSAGIAAALIFATSPFTSAYLRGMETPLYILLILGAFSATLRGHQTLALTVAALAVLVRLDGLAVFAVALGYFGLSRRLAWAALVPAAGLLGAWFTFATLEFGSPVPASGLAKIAHEATISGSFSLISRPFIYLLMPPVAVSVYMALVAVLAVLALSPVVLIASRKSSGALLAIWCVLYVAGFVGLGLPSFSWYYAPIAIVFNLLVWGFLEGLRRFPGHVVLGAASGMALLSLFLPLSTSESLVSPPAYWAAGQWLKEHAEPEATVAAYEVGMIGYVTNLKVIDLLGLTEPAARAHVRKGDYAWAIRDLNPTYIFAHARRVPGWPVTEAIYTSPEFVSNYHLVARFPITESSDYLLYERNAEP